MANMKSVPEVCGGNAMAPRHAKSVPLQHTPWLSGLAWLCRGLLLLMVSLGQSAHAADEGEIIFRSIPVQYIAALGEPTATAGDNAYAWGLWSVDPGPRGVRLNRFEQLAAAGGISPAKWKFHSTDWWLEEHGLIMENPDSRVAAGRYLVTGDREVTTMLTVYPMGFDGSQRWELSNGATLYDVTHLACRSARYTPASDENTCTPANARQSEFPVTPGGVMPSVEGCNKQDYAVLFVIGVVDENQ